MGNGSEPPTLDPHLSTAVNSNIIISTLLEGLVTPNPKTLKPEPGAASSWEISEDLTRYTFHLNKKGRWSNGDPVTAADFIFAWRRLLLPNLAAEYAYQLFVVKNAEAFYKGDITDFSQVGIKALDNYTLEVQLNAPTPYFLALLMHSSTYPLHPATVLKHGGVDDPGNLWTRPANYVGNGPFMLVEWALNRIVRVEKNPYYWDADTVKLNEVRFYPIDNVVTEERMFRSKTIHVTSTVAEEKIAAYKRNKPDIINISPYLGTYFYRFNVKKPPFNDVRVRRALSMSINRQQIVDAVTKGGEIPAFNLTPRNTLGYTPQVKIPFDIEQARKLLAEAGYPGGKGFPTSDILYNTSEGHRKIAVAIQQMWKKELGINITLYNQDWKAFLETEKNGDFEIARAGWIGDYVDPNTFLDMFVSGGGNNRTGWSSPEYDALIRQAASTGNIDARFDLFQRAEKILIDQSPIIPVYTYTAKYLISPDVKGWYNNVLNEHPLKYVYLERDQ
jgi:oligopeptide transport system substrate-binding protein